MTLELLLGGWGDRRGGRAREAMDGVGQNQWGQLGRWRVRGY